MDGKTDKYLLSTVLSPCKPYFANKYFSDLFLKRRDTLGTIGQSVRMDGEQLIVPCEAGKSIMGISEKATKNIGIK